MLGVKRRRGAVGGVALVAAALAVWQGGRILSGPVGQEAARLVAAEFLAVHPGDLQPTAAVFPGSRYDFLLERDGSRVAKVSVGRDPIFVCSGAFYGRSREPGEPQLNRAGALKAARRFARERLHDFRDLGIPRQVVPGRAGEASTWEVTWNVYRKRSGWRFLSVEVNSCSGDVIWFMARKADGPLRQPTVTREQAIAAARAEWHNWQHPESEDVITHVKARILRGLPERPDGYPVWDVTGLSVGTDGLVAGIECSIDGMTGDIIRPGLCAATITRERAIAIATHQWQDGGPPGSGAVTNVEARILRRGEVRPPGYPVWDVTGVRVGPGDGKRPVHCHIDALTGEVIQPPVAGPPRRPPETDKK